MNARFDVEKFKTYTQADRRAVETGQAYVLAKGVYDLARQDLRNHLRDLEPGQAVLFEGQAFSLHPTTRELMVLTVVS